MATFVLIHGGGGDVGPDEIDGGHMPALSRPIELAERLEAYAVQGLRPTAQ
jgi:hypothetical protein